MKTNTIIQGDALTELRKLPAESVDSIVTDPPYGYAFMGKDWDKMFVSVEVWRECLRVLKPGAFAFVMCAPRQDCLGEMIHRLTQAGFMMGFTSIYWMYASGFPKAQNIGKAVDKKLGAERERIKSTCGFVNSEGFRNDGNNQSGGKFGECVANDVAITPQAKALDGSYGGFQPKPAIEIILVCMKPIAEKTYVGQAMKNRKGCTWLDDCRIPYKDEIPSVGGRHNIKGRRIGTGENEYGFQSLDKPQANTQGRFPANVLCSDDALNDGKARSSGGRSGLKRDKWTVAGRRGERISVNHPMDSSVGSFSRYFDLDAWWSERIKTLPESVQKTFPYLIVPKASKAEKNAGCESRKEKQVNDGRDKLPDNAFQRGKTLRKNTHPTCKPIKLMSYLITLGSREGDVVLDPFVGSGTTCIAAKILNRQYVGIEKEKEYVEIAEARLAGAHSQPDLMEV